MSQDALVSINDQQQLQHSNDTAKQDNLKKDGDGVSADGNNQKEKSVERRLDINKSATSQLKNANNTNNIRANIPNVSIITAD